MQNRMSIHIEEVNQIPSNLIWTNKRYNIKNGICTLARLMFGIGMIDLQTVTKGKIIR